MSDYQIVMESVIPLYESDMETINDFYEECSQGIVVTENVAAFDGENIKGFLVKLSEKALKSKGVKKIISMFVVKYKVKIILRNKYGELVAELKLHSNDEEEILSILNKLGVLENVE